MTTVDSVTIPDGTQNTNDSPVSTKTPVVTHVSLESYIKIIVQQHLTNMGKQLMTHLTNTCTELLQPRRFEDPSGNRPMDLQAPEDPAKTGNRPPKRDQPNLKVLLQQEIGSEHTQGR